MERILNNVNEGIITMSSCSGEILFCNMSALKYLKFSKEELIGKKFFISIMIYDENLKTDVSMTYEVKNRFKEKQSVEGKFVQLANEDVLAFIFKIEEINMKKVSEMLYYELKRKEETEAELEGFLCTAVDCMTIIGVDGEFKRVSVGSRTNHNWCAEDFEDILWHDMVHPEDIKDMLRKLHDAKEKCELVRTKGRLKNKRDEWFWIETSSIYDKDRQVFINTSRDITEEKKIEEERRNYERLKELEKIKNDFFANISHEFKTPLNIILSLIQLIDYSIKENIVLIEPLDKFRKYIQGIKQNSFRLLRLSNNIIDMTKIDSGFYNIHKTNCNIVYILDNIVDSISDYVSTKGIELIFDPECEELITACDEEKIERIILNIISNSIKYIEGEGKILIELSIEKNLVVVKIKDNGIGISKENVDIIFERFKQVDSTFTRKVEGSGIGLSLVKSLVEMHDGEIFIESEMGKGTNVIFYLPIVVVSEEKANVECNMNENEVWKIEFADIYD